MTKILTIAAMLVLAAMGVARAQPLWQTQPVAPSAFSRCAKAADTSAVRLKNLVKAGDDARAAAEANPLLLADVGYYEAELQATRSAKPNVSCGDSVVTAQR